MKKYYQSRLENMSKEGVDYVRPDALMVEPMKTETKEVSVVKVIETDMYPVNHYFG